MFRLRPLDRREHTAAEARRDGASALPRPHICFVAPNAWPAFSRDPSIEHVGGAEVQQSILSRALAGAGYRVSVICLDFGQPQRVLLDGVTVYKAHRPDAGIPVLRFVHPRMTAMWRGVGPADADGLFQRPARLLPALLWAGCRPRSERSTPAPRTAP